MALLPTLITALEMEEASGNAVDSHGSHDFTQVGTISSTTGKVGNARFMDRANSERFTLTHHADYAGGDVSFMIATWVYFSTDTTFQAICAKHDGATAAGSEWLLCREADNELRLSIYSSSSEVQAVGSSVSISAWHFVCAGYNATENVAWISVNGGARVTTSHSGGWNNLTNDVQIGAVASTNYINGATDQWYYFTGRDYDTTDIAELYNGGDGVAYADLDAGLGSPLTSKGLLLGVGI